ncbi:MAG: hypothetical protein GY716_09680 [bacterium]|nr:hypothetical protein [bacterium]
MGESADRARALVLGLFAGSALGREGRAPGLEGSLAAAVATALIDAVADGPERFSRALDDALLGWAASASADDADSTTHEAVRRLRDPALRGESALAWSKESGFLPAIVPVGVVCLRYRPLLREVSLIVARRTHGHPTAHAAAVALATAVRLALKGIAPADWLPAMRQATKDLAAAELLALLEHAASAGDVSAMNELGEGWVAEEALALSWSALRLHADEPGAALTWVERRSGDLRTVGALTGAWIGAVHGEDAILSAWRGTRGELDFVRGLADRLLATQEAL